MMNVSFGGTLERVAALLRCCVAGHESKQQPTEADSLNVASIDWSDLLSASHPSPPAAPARCCVGKLKLCIPLTVPVERVSTSDKRGSVTRELRATAGLGSSRGPRGAAWSRRAPRSLPGHSATRGLDHGLQRGLDRDTAEHGGRCSAGGRGVRAASLHVHVRGRRRGGARRARRVAGRRGQACRGPDERSVSEGVRCARARAAQAKAAKAARPRGDADPSESPLRFPARLRAGFP